MQPLADKDTKRGSSSTNVANDQIHFTLRVVPLPAEVVTYLDRNAATIKDVQLNRAQFLESEHATELEDEEDVVNRGIRTLSDFKSELKALFAQQKDADQWESVVENICAFGPKRIGPNILVDHTPTAPMKHILRDLSDSTTLSVHKDESSIFTIHDFEDHLISGFQLATFIGPLCAEPVHGTCTFIEHFTCTVASSSTNPTTTTAAQDEEHEGPDDGLTTSSASTSATAPSAIAPTPSATELFRSRLTQTYGHIISAFRDTFKRGFMMWSPRLMLAMYSCEVQSSTAVLGRVYGVIGKRRGKIVSEELTSGGGSELFSIGARLPVVESFGFSDYIRKQTSGAASPQLIFTGFEVLDEDPFWVPRTEEEVEEFGVTGDREITSRKYIDGVRRRKGLFVESSKVTKGAEKQRTLKR